MVIANINITDPMTTPFSPSPIPSISWAIDIPLNNAKIHPDNNANPNAHLTLGDPDDKNV